MSIISDFVARLIGANSRVDAAIAKIKADIKAINDQITVLVTTQVSVADQAALEEVVTRTNSVADQLEALEATLVVPPSA